MIDGGCHVFCCNQESFFYNQPKQSWNRRDFLFARIRGSAFFCWNCDNFLLELFLVFATTREIPFPIRGLFLLKYGGGSRRRRRVETAAAGGGATTMPVLGTKRMKRCKRQNLESS
ncbi:hypothetical protein VPH35_049631 [Triticum aestivum]